MLRLSILLLLLLPSTALAQWERSAPAGSPAGFVEQPSLLFGADGRALVAWTGNEVSTPPRTHLATWAPGSTPAERRRLAGVLLAGPVALGSGHAVFARQTGTPERPRLIFTVARRSGTLRSTQTLSGYGFSYARAMASGPRGEVAFAWIESAPAGRLRLKLALRRSGGSFRVVETIDLGQDEHPGPAAVALAYRTDGDLVLAATAQRSTRRVEARIGRPGRWRRQVLGRHHGIADIAASAGGGRIVVAWQTQDGGEEANTPAETRAAILEPGRRVFSPTYLFDSLDGRERSAGSISSAVSRDGALAVLWSQAGRDHSQAVTLASARPRHGFGTPITLDPNGAAGGVAFADDGALLATWSRITEGNYQQPNQAFAAIRPASGAFGAAEPLSEVGEAGPPVAGYGGGRFVAAWGSAGRLHSSARKGP
jgi:hypothetical protein